MVTVRRRRRDAEESCARVGMVTVDASECESTNNRVNREAYIRGGVPLLSELCRFEVVRLSVAVAVAC